MSFSFVHIVNAVAESENKSLFELQKLTFASLQKAKTYSNYTIEQAICYHKDYPVEHKSFIHFPTLEKSIQDIGTFNNKKKLPLLKDILKLAYDNSKADYIIYSNADIGLMLPFYNAIGKYIEKGHDAIVVNRRRIKSTLNKPEDLDLIYTETGKDHLGFDMFVFKRDLLPKFILNNTCIGIPFVGNDLFYNLFCFANNPVLLTQQHLTFHVGLELIKDWGGSDLKNHNYREFRKTTKSLLPSMQIAKFPGSELGFLKRHLKWLMNPTISYPEMFICDLKQLGVKRPAKKNYDPNYKKQSYYEWLLKKVNFD